MDKKVWARHPELVWVQATIQSESGNNLNVIGSDGKGFSVAKSDTVHCSTTHSNPSLDNLIELDELIEPSILSQLRLRYTKDDIYTWIGSILVSINPYKSLPIYTIGVLQEFLSGTRKSQAHIYSLANMAYKAMSGGDSVGGNLNQAVIISGESGAGKTESTKLILQYLSEASSSSSKNGSDGIRNLILSVNPLLEAFGNAKTVRNDNSSRFGKWIEIHFAKNGVLAPAINGGSIENYLLEKSRVVTCAEGERGYHVFYQLCAACERDGSTRDLYGLDHPSCYKFLNNSSVHSIPNISDEQEYHDTLRAMQLINLSPEEIEGIFKVVSAILHLGNLEIGSKESSEGTVGTIQNPQILSKAASLLNFSKDLLERSLCTKEFGVGSVARINLRPEEVLSTRNSFCTTLYAKLFDWLIKKTNICLKTGPSSHRDFYIGVLDIFGFEIFDSNSFEQFCINFANEKLQNHFTYYILEMEQQEYIKESISFDFIKYQDNKDCIEMIEGKLGLFQLIEEEGVVPKGSDSSLLQKMNDKFGSHSRWSNSTKLALGFEIRHYAGSVTYSVEGFMVKNKDVFQPSLVECVSAGSNNLLKEVFADIILAQAEDSGDSSSTVGDFASRRNQSVRSSARTKKVRSIGTQFKSQLSDLMATINASNPFFVRCIKPNTEKKAGTFDAAYVLKQMSYSGIFEAIHIRATGYPVRVAIDRFVHYYKPTISASQRNELSGKSSTEACAHIISCLNGKIDVKEVSIGKTKVFMKVSVQKTLHSLREEACWRFIVKIQAVGRGYIIRKRILKRKRLIERAIQALNGDSIDEVQAILQEEDELWAGIGADLVGKLESKKAFLHFKNFYETKLQNAVESKNINTLEQLLMEMKDKDIEKKVTDPYVRELILSAKQLASNLGSQINVELEANIEFPDAMEFNSESELNKLLQDKQKMEAKVLQLEKDIKSLKEKISECNSLIKVATKKSKEKAKKTDSKPEPIQPDGDAKLTPHESVPAFQNRPHVMAPLTIEDYIPVRDYALKLHKYADRYSMSSVSDLRSKANYAKRNFFKKRFEIQESMMEYSENPIPRSLIKWTKADFADSPEGLNKWRHLKEMGKSIFKNLLYYMGINYHSFPATIAQEILKYGKEEPLLRDEIYLQLVKQSTKNPNEKMCILVLKLMFLCLRLFPPQRQSVEHILRSHLASKAPRYMSKFVGFGSVRSASGHCWEAIEAYSRGVPLVEGYSVEQVQSFTNLHGFFMPLFDGKSQEFLVIEIPVIPDIIRPIFPYESVTGPIQCADLVKYAAKELKLPYVPNLMLENKPSYADIYLEPNDTIPGDSILEEVLAKLGDDLGEVHWILLETSIPFTPDSDDIVSPTNSATRAMSNRLDSEGGRTTLSTQASRPKFDFKMPSEISEPKLVARKSTMQKSTVTPAESAVKPRNLVRASIRSSVAPKSTVHSIPDSAPSKLPPATPQEISGSEDALVPPPPPPPPPAPKAPLPRAAGYVPKKKNHKDAPPTKPVPNINSRLTTKSSSPPKKPVPNNPMPDPEVLVPVPPPAPPLV